MHLREKPINLAIMHSDIQSWSTNIMVLYCLLSNLVPNSFAFGSILLNQLSQRRVRLLNKFLQLQNPHKQTYDDYHLRYTLAPNLPYQLVLQNLLSKFNPPSRGGLGDKMTFWGPHLNTGNISTPHLNLHAQFM